MNRIYRMLRTADRGSPQRLEDTRDPGFLKLCVFVVHSKKALWGVRKFWTNKAGE